MMEIISRILDALALACCMGWAFRHLASGKLELILSTIYYEIKPFYLYLGAGSIIAHIIDHPKFSLANVFFAAYYCFVWWSMQRDDDDDDDRWKRRRRKVSEKIASANGKLVVVPSEG